MHDARPHEHPSPTFTGNYVRRRGVLDQSDLVRRPGQQCQLL